MRSNLEARIFCPPLLVASILMMETVKPLLMVSVFLVVTASALPTAQGWLVISILLHQDERAWARMLFRCCIAHSCHKVMKIFMKLREIIITITS